MSYTDFLQETTSEKIVLLEFDELEELVDSFWIKHSSKLWKTTYSWDVESREYVYGNGAWGWGSYGSTEIADLPSPDKLPLLKVASLVIELDNYTLTSSEQDCENLQKSFFWDNLNQILYIHPPDRVDPMSFELIALGVTQGFSSKSGYYNELYYEGRISKIPKIKNTRDVQYYGLISFDGGSVSLINVDGYFDKLTNRGQAIRLYFGGDDLEYSEYEQIFTGYLEELDIQAEDIKLGLRDQRKLLEKSIPISIIDDVTYPDTPDNGSYKQIAYGSIKKAIPWSLDGDANPRISTYRFLVADPEYTSINSIESVLIDGVSVPYTSDLTTNIINISSTYYLEDSDQVTVSFITDLDQPLDIIQDLITKHTNIKYTEEFFNLTEWEYYKTIITQPLSIFISDDQEIIDIIGDICGSVLGLFIVQGDGKFTFRQQDLEKEVVKDIKIDEIVSKVKVKYDHKNYASSVRVGYNQDYSEEKYNYYLNDEQETTLRLQYRVEKRKELETYLKNSDDAIVISNSFLSYYGGFFPTFTFATKTQNMDIQLADNVGLQTYFYETGDYATIKLEIIGIEKDFNKNTITFTGRYIEDDPGEINIGGLLRWSGKSSYKVSSVATSGGQLWRSIQPSINQVPSPSSEFWEEFGKLYWFDNVNYIIGDIVIHDGKQWRSNSININSEPGVSSSWDEVYTPTQIEWDDSQSDISTLQGDVTDLETDVIDLETDVTTLQSDVIDLEEVRFFQRSGEITNTVIGSTMRDYGWDGTKRELVVGTSFGSWGTNSYEFTFSEAGIYEVDATIGLVATSSSSDRMTIAMEILFAEDGSTYDTPLDDTYVYIRDTSTTLRGTINQRLFVEVLVGSKIKVRVGKIYYDIGAVLTGAGNASNIIVKKIKT